ncbi:MAG: ABC transporter ATP-binding protein, partial [Oligoflexales bacterium]
QGGEEMDPLDFDEFLREKLKFLNMPADFINRQVNVDFSGGEKKRNEILQMAVLAPRLAFLDETDSGLDVDSLKLVANGVNKLKNEQNGIVLITHYHRLLEHIEPDFVHVLHNGKITRTGTKELALEIEQKGYEHLIN